MDLWQSVSSIKQLIHTWTLLSLLLLIQLVIIMAIEPANLKYFLLEASGYFACVWSPRTSQGR